MTLTRSPARSHVRDVSRALTDLVGGISDPSISLSAPDFGGSTYYEGVDDNDITVTISNFEPSTSYTISVSSDGGGTPPANATGTTDINGGASAVMNITGLNAGLVTFTATVSSDVKTRNATLAAQAAPDAPTNLVATHGDTQVGLSWDAPANVNGAVITDYVIEVDSGSGFSTITDGVNTNTTYTHTGLTNGTEYTYRVSAVNSVGTGAASATASATPCTVPDQVGTVTPTPGNGQVALAWSAPANGGSPITDYVVQYRETGSGSWLTFPEGTNASTGATVTGLANGTEYEFQVAAVNNEGQGAFSAAATATTNDVPAQVGVVTPTSGNAEVALSWAAPSNGGSVITDYIVQYKLSSSGTWSTFPDGVGTGATATVTGLTNDSAYDFRVAAVNANGTGAYSATVSETPADGYNFTNTEAETVVNAFTTEPNDTRKGEIDTLIGALKTAGVWSKLDVLYVLAAHDSQAARINWKSPGNFTLTEVNSPTFTADRGYAGDGSTSYLNTGWDGSTDGVQFTQNDAHISAWSLSDRAAATSVEMLAGWQNGLSRTAIINHFSSLGTAGRINGNNGFRPDSTSLGFVLASRSSSSNTEVWRDGTSLGTNTTGSNALVTNDCYICGQNSGSLNSPTTDQIAMMSLGADLATEEQDYYDALNTYMTAVGAVT